jgi:asparagine synthase (glutamine-hydrolysing)
MCGICGVVQVEGRRRPVVPVDVLDRMTDVMTHRGPNDRGTYISDGFALGVRRLSIVDVAGGHQPFANEDGSVWAAQNGELYNHEPLRAELQRDRHAFASACDTEILPHLYERNGTDLPKLLRGKFALAVMDVRRGRTLIARDRLGVKPLYYARAGDLLVFASELKSVLASGLVGPDLDLEAIEAYLTFGFFAGPSTPLRDVRKLLPGHSLVVEDGGVRSERYWELPYPGVAGEPPLDEREYADGLVEILEDSVRARLMSDVPLGAMLSGGLDSSVVVALMARNSSAPIKTFSVAFKEDASGNELADARLVSDTFGTDHHELELSLADQTVSLEELVWHLDEPLADLSSVGLYALSKVAARHVTVALAGQGADELLGGYPVHRNAALADRWSRLPGAVRRVGPAASRLAPRRYRRAVTAVTAPDPVSRALAQSSKLGPELRGQLLRSGRSDPGDGPARRVIESFLDGRAGGALDSALYLHQQFGLVDDMLQYFDRASMATSLEVRVPFLDHHVVEFCASVPDELKVKGLEGKHLLRVAARGLIPDRIIDKSKIGFFSHAVDAWFREQAAPSVRDYLLAPDAAYAALRDRDAVATLVAGSTATGGHGAGNSLLLSILMLEVWLTTFLPRALSPSRALPVGETATA